MQNPLPDGTIVIAFWNDRRFVLLDFDFSLNTPDTVSMMSFGYNYYNISKLIETNIRN